MTPFQQELADRLAAIREAGLYRELRCLDSAQTPHIRLGNETLLNFSSNDYLGLANEPALKESAIHALERFGAGAGASRLICGSLRPHHDLEAALAEFKAVEAALAFSSGYAAALGTVVALLGKQDVIIVDKLVHACIVDAARLCGAKLRVFAHNDLADLESILRWADTRQALSGARPRTLVVTESVFSMDGDGAPLQELVELKDKYGAWLMVDEAHATGLFGVHRRGLAEAAGVSDRIEIQMGTLGKALGAAGGYICGSRLLVDYLINRARSFIFSTAPVPAAAAAAAAGVGLVQSPLGAARCESLRCRLTELPGSLARASSACSSAIVPIPIGDEARAVEVAADLRAEGIFIPAIRFPTVARGEARLRLTLTAAHTAEDLAQLRSALGKLAPAMLPSPPAREP